MAHLVGLIYQIGALGAPALVRAAREGLSRAGVEIAPMGQVV